MVSIIFRLINLNILSKKEYINRRCAANMSVRISKTPLYISHIRYTIHINIYLALHTHTHMVVAGKHKQKPIRR